MNYTSPSRYQVQQPKKKLSRNTSALKTSTAWNNSRNVKQRETLYGAGHQWISVSQQQLPVYNAYSNNVTGYGGTRSPIRSRATN